MNGKVMRAARFYGPGIALDRARRAGATAVIHDQVPEGLEMLRTKKGDRQRIVAEMLR